MLFRFKRNCRPVSEIRSRIGWWNRFKERHPEVVFRCPESLSKGRRNLSEMVMRQWFSDIRSYLSEKDMLHILQDPSRLFNFDETSTSLSPKTGRVLGIKGTKNCFQTTSNAEKKCITVFSTVGKNYICTFYNQIQY